VKAILRRGRLPTIHGKTLLSHKGLVVDQEKRKITLNDQPIDLTPHEFNLLQAIMAFPGKVFTREELLARLYPRQDVTVIDRVVDVHIGKLRQKIEKDPSHPQFILTVRGIGYRFAEADAQ
jgi:DNA-binding response OmpR family regulator